MLTPVSFLGVSWLASGTVHVSTHCNLHRPSSNWRKAASQNFGFCHIAPLQTEDVGHFLFLLTIVTAMLIQIPTGFLSNYIFLFVRFLLNTSPNVPLFFVAFFTFTSCFMCCPLPFDLFVLYVWFVLFVADVWCIFYSIRKNVDVFLNSPALYAMLSNVFLFLFSWLMPLLDEISLILCNLSAMTLANLCRWADVKQRLTIIDCKCEHMKIEWWNWMERYCCTCCGFRFPVWLNIYDRALGLFQCIWCLIR